MVPSKLRDASCWKPAELPIWNNLQKGEGVPFAAVPPALAYAAENEQDVVEALQYAVQSHLQVAARSTGHHCGALCLAPGGLIVDLGEMRAVTVDPERRTVRVQPGVTARALYRELQPHGLHFPGPHISGLGLAGFSLGGGVGWNGRGCGYACDNILGATVIVPSLPPYPAAYSPLRSLGGSDASSSGQVAVVRASAGSHPELFWALRGGGMFVGIVTELELRLHAAPAAITTAVMRVPFASAAPAFAAWCTLVERAPDSLHPMFVLGWDASGAAAATLAFYDFSTGDEDREAAAAAVAACLRVVEAMEGCAVLFSGELPILDALASHDEMGDFPRHCAYNCSSFVDMDAVDAPFFAVLSSHVTACSAPKSAIVIEPTARQAAADEGAFGDRSKMLWFEVLTAWERTEGGAATDGDEGHVAWAQALRRELQPWVKVDYINNNYFSNSGGGGAIVTKESCFSPEAWQRLKRVKAEYDPQGVLPAME